jgi:hypothetical protein
MNDDTSIFTDADDSVGEEIAANEARHEGSSHLSRFEQTLETVVSPMTRALEDPDLTPEERRQSHEEQERNTGQS